MEGGWRTRGRERPGEECTRRPSPFHLWAPLEAAPTLTLKDNQLFQLSSADSPSPNSVSHSLDIMLGSESPVRQSFDKRVEDKVSKLILNEKGDTW